MEDDLKAIMAEVLELPVGSVDESTSMETVGSWDSLRHMELIVAVEHRFQVEFEAQETLEMTNLAGIRRILAAKALPS